MIFYQTDHEGFFVGPVKADESPLEPGVWLIPGGAVEQEPPALQEGERAQWTDGEWQVIPPPEPEPEPEPAPPEPVTRIERRQGLRALLSQGIKRANIEAMIAAIQDETEREIALAEYEHTHWTIESPFIAVGAAHFGMSEEQVQALFEQAATL